MPNQIITPSTLRQTQHATFRPEVVTAREREEKLITVYCDLCAESMTASLDNLKRFGWEVYQTCCFCPFHEEI